MSILVDAPSSVERVAGYGPIVDGCHYEDRAVGGEGAVGMKASVYECRAEEESESREAHGC